MGWYSLYKWFRTFRKSPSTNYISWYKHYLYNEWYDSLSDEDKLREDDRVRRLREHEHQRTQDALRALGMMYSMVYAMGVNALGRSKRPAYLQPDPRLAEISDALSTHLDPYGLLK